jgi:hypothetical protein
MDENKINDDEIVMFDIEYAEEPSIYKCPVWFSPINWLYRLFKQDSK